MLFQNFCRVREKLILQLGKSIFAFDRKNKIKSNKCEIISKNGKDADQAKKAKKKKACLNFFDFVHQK